MIIDQRLVHLARSQSLRLMLAVLLGVLVGILVVLQALWLSEVIAQVFLEGAAISLVLPSLVILLLVIAGRSILTWFGEFCARTAAATIMRELRLRLISHIFQLGPVKMRDQHSGELVNTLTEGIDTLDTYFSQYLPQVVLAAFVPLTYLFFIFPLDPLSGLILLLTAPLIPLFMILIGNLAETITHRQWVLLSQMSAFYLDILQGLTTLKALGQSLAVIKQIDQVNNRYTAVTLKVLRVTFLSALALEMVSTLSTAIVAVEIGLRLLHGHLRFEQALFILLLAPEFYMPMRTLGIRFHAGMAGISAAKRIFEILGLPVQNSGELESEDGSRQIGNLSSTPSSLSELSSPLPGIHFEGVSFGYSPGRPALHEITFSISPGQTVALVGKSGAGKSTIADLLLGFIQPQQGEISIGNNPLSVIDTDKQRNLIAWLPQRPYLFYTSVEENILLGNPQASHEMVVRAAQLAQADGFIRDLPIGYQTQIGERGARLSGGEAQRIALARAFLMDAPIVILDEAASNLDPETEALLSESILHLLQGRTAIVIAHHLDIALKADHVIVLDDGRVVEQGSPVDLLAKDGLFAMLVGEYYYHTGSSKTLTSNSKRTWNLPLNHGSRDVQLLRKMNRKPDSLLPVHSTDDKDADKNIRSSKVFQWLASFLRPHAFQVFLSLMLGFLTVMSGVGLMAFSAYLISTAALMPSIADLQIAVVMVRAFGISRGLFRYMERLLSHGVTLRILGDFRLSFYQGLEPLAPARLMRYRGGDLLHRIVGDINHLEDFFVRGIAPVLTAVLVSLVVGLYLGRFEILLAVVLWGMMFIAGAFFPWLIHQMSRLPGRLIIELQADLSVLFVDGIQGMADLLAYNAGSRYLNEAARVNARLTHLHNRLAGIDALQNSITVFLANLCMWVVLVLTIPMVEKGTVPGVMLAVLILITLSSFEAILPLPKAAQRLESNLTAGRQLLEVIDGKSDVIDPVKPRTLPERFEIEVTELNFTYPPEITFAPCESRTEVERPVEGNSVLREVSFNLQPTKKLAVVGASGAGKSTLVSLLLRFWEIQEEMIRINGVDLHSFLSRDIRNRIGVVSQHTYLFNTSLYENLMIAKPQATRGEIMRVIEKAQLKGWIESLPLGLDTQVGELGMQISGGERQRVAIARALLRDPALLILDEPTANLDSITGIRILEDILAVASNRALLLITHRLVGLGEMDEIIVMHEGRVVECGKQAELLAYRGYYRRMWELQRECYE